MAKNANNKVKFNIKNVHYAIMSSGADGTVTYATPVPIPGAVSISLDPNGEPSKFYADGVVYYVVANNQGYEGDLEIALVPESFLTDVLQEVKDNKGVLVENANVAIVNFALLFEFDGDVKSTRHVMYNCSVSRPSIESKTNEDEIEVQTETLTISVAPLDNGMVKSKTTTETDDTVYNNWYKSVYMSTESATPATQSAQYSAKKTEVTAK